MQRASERKITKLKKLGILYEDSIGVHVVENPVQAVKQEQGNQRIKKNFYNFILKH